MKQSEREANMRIEGEEGSQRTDEEQFANEVCIGRAQASEGNEMVRLREPIIRTSNTHLMLTPVWLKRKCDTCLSPFIRITSERTRTGSESEWREGKIVNGRESTTFT